MSARHSFLEATARQRAMALLDPGSFREACPPQRALLSPHLALLDLPQALDDGIVTASGTLHGHAVLLAAQEGGFNGGSVGEIHGAKLLGLLQSALSLRPAGVLLLIDSGGVRLHEANAGILAISEVARAVLAVRAAGIPVLALLGGRCGAFGGMGIVSCLCDRVLMSEEARLGLSGPEVIETVKGRAEFDSRDRALVWRVTGGKTRRALGDAHRLVDDAMDAFRMAAGQELEQLRARPPQAPDLAALEAQQRSWVARHQAFGSAQDSPPILAARLHAPAPADWDSAAAFENALLPPLPVPADAPAMLAGQPPLRALGAEDQAWADRVFGPGRHRLAAAAGFLAGSANVAQGQVWVIGTRDGAAIDAALALRMARAVLDAIAHDRASAACSPLLLLADTQGQALSRHQELLCLNGALAHLAQCVDLARRERHPLLTLVRNEAVSGGFLSFGMLGDLICALPQAEIRVMDLRAMARVTRIPLERLQQLALSAPAFAPGAANFHSLGGVHQLWQAQQHWPDVLAQALAAIDAEDRRAALGQQRGGRKLARQVADQVRTALGA